MSRSHDTTPAAVRAHCAVDTGLVLRAHIFTALNCFRCSVASRVFKLRPVCVVCPEERYHFMLSTPNPSVAVHFIYGPADPVNPSSEFPVRFRWVKDSPCHVMWPYGLIPLEKGSIIAFSANRLLALQSYNYVIYYATVFLSKVDYLMFTYEYV